jgi:hypothetical protein
LPLPRRFPKKPLYDRRANAELSADSKNADAAEGVPLPEFSGAPADRIVDQVERDQPGVQQVKALSGLF